MTARSSPHTTSTGATGGRRGSRRAARRLAGRRAGQADGGHGPVGLRQVDADAHPGGARPPDRRLRHDRRHPARTAERQGHHEDPAEAHRLHLPVLQPAPDADRRGEHDAAARARRPEARQGVLRGSRQAGRARRPPDPQALRALRRPAAARRDRARARHPPDGRLRRRADRQPRLEDRRRDPRAAARVGRELRPDDGHGHARGARAASADRILFLADGEIVKDLGGAGEEEILDTIRDVTLA